MIQEAEEANPATTNTQTPNQIQQKRP
jgi:hypothetical protein